MAKFISSIITEASGSVAGTTYSRNKNGSYIRNKSVPVNRNTLAQQAARAIFSGVSSGWKGLSPDQRASFENQIMNYPYVDSLGQTKYYTASQLYKSLNNSLMQLGLPGVNLLGAPIPMKSVINTEVITIQAGAGTMRINTMSFSDGTNDTVPEGFTLAVYATDVKGNGFTSPKNSDFRYIAVVPPEGDPTTAQLDLGYNAVFGTGWTAANNTNAKIWFGFKLVAEATGQRNNSYYMNQSNIDLTA